MPKAEISHNAEGVESLTRYPAPLAMCLYPERRN